MYYLLLLIVCLLDKSPKNQVNAARYKTVYQKIQEDPRYLIFNDLVSHNRAVVMDLLYSPLTVFVPDQNAFDTYDEDTYSDLAFYHMSFEVKTLKLLKNAEAVLSVKLDNPPFWISKVNEDIYVNNAKILLDQSNYVSRSVTGQQQVMHVVDEVLDPMIKSPQFAPNAYDFLVSTPKWNLGPTKTVNKFYQKAQLHQALHFFKRRGPNTFFIPIDSGTDLNAYNMMNSKVILRHLVPNHVLFTRPSEKNVVNISDEDEDFYTISFETINERLHVKCYYKPFVDVDFQEFSSEVILPNIPVKNGVVHLISKPLGDFTKKLKPFPYLPIMEKISNDPNLDMTYKMGTITKFNQIFEKQNVNFTYFVARDSSWFSLGKQGLEPIEDTYEVLAKHLVISETPYSMQQLAAMTRINNYTDIVLNTVGGPLKFAVFRNDGSFFIRWKKNYVEVVRADYECTNGLVHVLSGPLIEVREHIPGKNPKNFSSDLGDYWNILKGIVMARNVQAVP